MSIEIRFIRHVPTECIAAVFMGEVLGFFPDKKVAEEAINQAEAENMLHYWTAAMEQEAWLHLNLAALGGCPIEARSYQ